MAIPPAHLKVNVYGTILQAAGGGADVFTFGICGSGSVTPATLAPLALSAATTVWTASGSGVEACAQLNGVRVEQIDSTGKVTASFNSASSSQPTGLNTNINVGILSNAVSLQTAAVDSKGRKIWGRFYPPANTGTIIGTTTVVSLLPAYNSAWNTFVKALNTAGLVACVASSTGVGLATVTGTSVDNQVDTQRSRKNRVTIARSPQISV